MQGAQRERTRYILTLVSVALLPGIILAANSAYSDWRSALRSDATRYPWSVILALILLEAWVLLSVSAVIQWTRGDGASSRGKATLSEVVPHSQGLRSRANLASLLAIVCIVIGLVPYAGYFFLGPPAALGTWFAASAVRAGDRRLRVFGAFFVNLAALSFALLAVAMLAGWVN